MNHEDFVRELARTSYAPLSATELEDMAKQASSMFLIQDTPLTEAVVKVAQACRGLSSEQVRRVAEMANTCTFQRLFEKSAGDRNVQFKIADPNEALRQLNSSASAPIVKVASDYSRKPPVTNTKDLEADMQLCEAFGVEPVMDKEALLTGALTGYLSQGDPDKTRKSGFWRGMAGGAVGEVAGTALGALAGKAAGGLKGMQPGAIAGDMLGEIAGGYLGGRTARPQTKTAMIDPNKGSAALQILQTKEQTMKAQKKVIEMQMKPPEPMAPPNMQQLGANIRPPMQPPMQQQAAPAQQQPILAKMAGEDCFKEITAGFEGREYGVPQKMVDQGHARVVNQALSGGLRGGLHGGIAGLVTGGALGALRSAPGLGNRLIGGLSGGLAGAPIGAALGGVSGLAGGISDAEGTHKREVAELIARRAAMSKEAMIHVKSHGSGSKSVETELRSQYSLDSIKTAAQANELSYVEAAPFGDLVRSRQILTKQADDVCSAVDENAFHIKEAQAQLNQHTLQHLLWGGNIGEVVQLMAGLGTEDQVKEAMIGVGDSPGIVKELEKKLPAYQFTQLQADLISYEMEKSASVRIVNPEHPIARAFAGIVKLSADQAVLEQAKTDILSLLEEANALVCETSKTRV